MTRTTRIQNGTLMATALSLLLAGGHAIADDDPKTHADNAAGDSDQPVDDTWITTKVKADLLASKGVSGTDVSVETKDGVVWLSGTTATKAEKDRTVAKAKAIEGVKSVNATKLKVVAATKK